MPAWHPHPDIWLVVVALGLGYEWAVRRVGPSMVHPVERVVTLRHRLLFYTGLALLWLASDWPMHELAEGTLYSAHMLQHMVYAYVAPALLLVGTPDWMLRRLLLPVIGVARFVTRPAVGLVVFNVALALVHVPVVLELMLVSEAFHFAMHAMLLLAALCMWSPVLNPLIELPHLSYPGRMFYLFLQSLVPTVPASFLTFADAPIYQGYTGAFGIDVLTDQQIAGLLMKIGGGAVLWTVIAWYFFRWFQTEEREKVDVLEWGKLEHDLNKAELMER